MTVSVKCKTSSQEKLGPTGNCIPLMSLSTFLLFPADKDRHHQAISPEGDSTAPPSQASERSDLPRRSNNASAPAAKTATPATVKPSAAAATSKPEPRGRGGGTGVLVGDQPPLDVDALLQRQQQQQVRHWVHATVSSRIGSFTLHTYRQRVQRCWDDTVDAAYPGFYPTV